MAYKNVLVVEDDYNSRVGMEFALEEITGLKPDSAGSPGKAIEMARGKSYDLCISDGLKGEWLALYEEITSVNPSIKFILLSGDSRQADIARGKRIEVYDKSEKWLEKLSESIK